jgi:hypothetical protein
MQSAPRVQLKDVTLPVIAAAQPPFLTTPDLQAVRF